MDPLLKKFRATPAVVKADAESEITIESLEGSYRFYDDITYEITFTPQDESDVPLDEEMSLVGYEKARKTYLVKPENGRLKLRHFFAGEQEWRIHISTREYKKHENPLFEPYRPYWKALIELPKKGIDVHVYSLNDDLRIGV